MSGVGGVLSGAATQVGRYFNVLTVLPSALLVTYIYGLASSRAWTGHPNWGAAVDGFELRVVALLAFGGVVVGLVLHPLQYAFTQFLEGYWGTSRPAVRAMAWRLRHHRRRRQRLEDLRDGVLDELNAAGQDPNKRLVTEPYLQHLAVEGEAARMSAAYPEAAKDVRPTRLGNVLRRYEAVAGSQYELRAVVVVPHLAQIAPERDVGYLEDQRVSLDLAVRLVVVSALATCASVVFLWRAGPWLLLSLAPYTLMYMFYRGAVVTGGGYGVAYSVLIDLNRFALYERLGLRRPQSTRAERVQNQQLMGLLRGDQKQSLTYARAEGTQKPTT